MSVRTVAFTFLGISLHAAHLLNQSNIPANVLAVDSQGNAFLLNNNSSLTKLDSNGNVLYSRQLSLPPGNGFALAVDSAGNVFIAGSTNSDSLPTSPSVFQPERSPGICITGDMAAQPYPCPDAFVAKFDVNGNLAWASYLGGRNIDQANAVAVDPAGNAYVAGFTLSSDFPVVNAFQSSFGGYADAFLAKISADGTRILYSSYLGSSGYDVAHAVAVDSGGNAYVAGDLGGSAPSFSPAGFGATCGADRTSAFLAKVSAGGSQMIFGGCLGSPATYSSGSSVTIDRQGNVYLGGNTQ